MAIHQYKYVIHPISIYSISVITRKDMIKIVVSKLINVVGTFS